MALPNPASGWKFAKYLLRIAEYAIPASYAYVESLLSNHEPVENPQWIRWVTTFTRTTPTGTSEDKAQFKLDLVNITGGAIDTSWTAGDFAAVQARMVTFKAILQAQMSAGFTFSEYRAYRMAFNPADPGPGQRSAANGLAFADTGPPVYVGTLGGAGTGTAGVPYQVSGTCTLRTAFPRHWGRIYLPTPGVASFDTSGRLVSGYRTAIANGMRALVNGLADDGFLVAVPMTDLGKQTFHGLLGVSDVVVDDVPDVQRRRRPKMVAAKTVGA